MLPLVSILIPAYNAEKWIGDAIRSAVAQNWSRTEVIVVDDGSRDNTLSVARAFASASVKVVSQENRGASAARNKALSFAQGDYIQWLDADDILAPDKVSEQMKLAEREYCSVQLLSSAFGVFHYRLEKAKFTPTEIWRDLQPIEWILRNYSCGTSWMVPASWLISRQLSDNAGPWDERLSLNDDGEYISRVVLASKRVRFVGAAKVYYRSTASAQLSRHTSEKGIHSLLLSLKLCIEHLRSFEDSEGTRKACIALLQMYSGYFYTEESGWLQEIDALAQVLGGALVVPRDTWKVSVLASIVGRRRASRIIAPFRKLRLDTAVKWDETLFYMGRIRQAGFGLK